MFFKPIQSRALRTLILTTSLLVLCGAAPTVLADGVDGPTSRVSILQDAWRALLGHLSELTWDEPSQAQPAADSTDNPAAEPWTPTDCDGQVDGSMCTVIDAEVEEWDSDILTLRTPGPIVVPPPPVE